MPPAPTPEPPRFSLSDWGTLVGIVTAVTTALYALWRVVLMPLQRLLARHVLREEMAALALNGTAIQTLTRQHAGLYGELAELRTDIEKGFAAQTDETRELRKLIVETLGRRGGQRSYDQRGEE